MNITDILTTVIAALGIVFMSVLAIAPLLLDSAAENPRRAPRRTARPSRPSLSDHVIAA